MDPNTEICCSSLSVRSGVQLEATYKYIGGVDRSSGGARLIEYIFKMFNVVGLSFPC